MKIIFLRDIPKVGKKYETKEVADGYGRHLVSQKLAEPATKEVVARIQNKMATDATMKKVHAELLMKNLDAISGTGITIHGKANEKGHLFASIHKEEVLTELKRAAGIDMNPDYVILERPLKETGTYEIPVMIEKNRVTFKVVVEALK
ncbi:MAG: 50S ribosomal protein L9 [Candidatus Pacebacteria bacterium]|jgi:large subunit ribosomal protein L9|nr:50S ribosomal protein L9 [Candidatus Paceibacterota bacterium]